MAGKLFLHSFDVFAIKLCFMYLNRLAPISNNSNKSLQPPPSILLPPSVDTSIPSTRVGILFFNCDTPPPIQVDEDCSVILEHHSAHEFVSFHQLLAG